MKKFFVRIDHKLLELDKKRSWLLAKTGIKPSTWSTWRKQERMPSADQAVAIASALGVSVEFLVDGRETPFDYRGANPLLGQIMQQLSGMSQTQLQEVLTLITTAGLKAARS
jgi:transcriptional regulator with XRE-family HTH domain